MTFRKSLERTKESLWQCDCPKHLKGWADLDWRQHHIYWHCRYHLFKRTQRCYETQSSWHDSYCILNFHLIWSRDIIKICIVFAMVYYQGYPEHWKARREGGRKGDREGAWERQLFGFHLIIPHQNNSMWSSHTNEGYVVSPGRQKANQPSNGWTLLPYPREDFTLLF